MAQPGTFHAADPPALPDASPPTVAGARPTPFKAVAPIALLGLGVVALVFTLVAIAADSQNRLAVRSAQHLAGSALRVESEQVAASARDYAYWNDAAENLVLDLDEDWAAGNVGAWAYDNLGMHAALLLDGDLRLIYGAVDGIRSGPELPSRFSPELAQLVAEARARTAEPAGGPAAVTSYLEFDGTPTIAGAATIRWEDGRPGPLLDGAPAVLVYVRRVDDAMLARIGDLYLLPDTKLIPARQVSRDSIALRSIGGRELARLAWTGKRPGTALVRELAMPLAGIAVLAVVLMGLIVRRAQRSAAELRRGHARLESQTHALRASTTALQSALAEAARANAAKSDFLARMSHELRTPLNAILGFSEIIALELYGPNSNPRYRDYGRMIHTSGDHLLSLINDILDLAKIEAGRFELVEEAADLQSIVEQCLGLLEPKTRLKSLRIDYEPRACRLTADARALKQILLNLLSNAVKFTPDGGTITVRAGDGPDGVVIAVSDTGCGMSRDDLERVFQVFGQVRAGAARDVEGSGLGLNIAKGLVEMHGGTLTIDSEVGGGTRATVRFDPSRSLPPAALAAAG